MNGATLSRVGVVVFAGAGVLTQACGDSGSGGAGGSPTSADASSSASTTKAAAQSSSVAPSVNVSTTGGMVIDDLGAACSADTDCDAPYTCLRSSDNWPALGGGGPALGYCTKACAGAADCGDGNVCIGNGANAHCAAGCEIGVPDMMFLDEDLDPNKCHGRPETPCFERSGGGVCRPVCQSDAECGAGRVCHVRTGSCQDMPSSGLPLGSACDPNNNQCAGICVSFADDGGSFCSSYCTFGGADLTTECGGTTNGLCFFASTGHELGDQAFCTAACAAQDECQNPLFFCFPVGGIEGNGFCIGATDCPNGDGDCATIEDTVCTPTAYGPKCLNPAIPMTGEGGGGSSSSASSASTASSASATASSSASGTGGAGGN